MRLIDADKLKQDIDMMCDGFDGIKMLVDEAPTIDAEPVRHGEWLLKHIGHGHYWECSACHTNPCIYVTENTKYCPNCGCKMDGV